MSCSMLRPLMREFHTSANWVAFNAEAASLWLPVLKGRYAFGEIRQVRIVEGNAAAYFEGSGEFRFYLLEDLRSAGK